MWLALGAPNVYLLVLGIFAPEVTGRLAISMAELGIITGGGLAISVIAALLSGRWADRRPARWTLTTCLVIGGGGLLAIGLANDAWLLAFGVAAASVAAAAAEAATNSTVRTQLTARWRPLAAGVKQTGVPAMAVAVSALVFGSDGRLDWRVLSSGVGLLALVTAILSWWSLAAGATGPEAGAPAGRPAAGLRHWPLVQYAFLMGAVGTVVALYLPTYLRAAAGFTVGDLGVMSAVMAVLGVVGRIGWAYLCGGRVPVAFALGVISVVAALAVATLPSLSTNLHAWLVTVGLAVTVASWHAVAAVATVQHANAGQVGWITGRVTAGFLAGCAAGSAVLGPLGDGTNRPTLLWGVCAAILVATIVPALATRPVPVVPDRPYERSGVVDPG